MHDLRHTFAVRRILAWYEAGVDVQAKLPLLATYMGHAHFEDTAYYLDAGGELLTKAAEHFEQHRSHAHD
jgi:integrase